MGVLWVCYGYPVVQIRNYLLKTRAKVRHFFDICKFLGREMANIIYICPKWLKMGQKTRMTSETINDVCAPHKIAGKERREMEARDF